jgi:hypothetical protein
MRQPLTPTLAIPDKPYAEEREVDNTIQPRRPARKGYDIGRFNLIAALGLPGNDEPDVHHCLNYLHHAAECVARKTAEWRPVFERDAEQFDDSEAVFRTMIMCQTLSQDLGVKYNLPTLELDDENYLSDPRNLFIHGIIEGDGGTCASMPVLFIAVGRRLGYPLKFVHTLRHGFARWEGATETFNIECTSPGFLSHSNEHYLNWPDKIPVDLAMRMRWLLSQTPKQEVQWFGRQRTSVFLHHGMLKEAVEEMEKVYNFLPNPQCWNALEHLRSCLRDGRPWNDSCKPC